MKSIRFWSGYFWRSRFAVSLAAAAIFTLGLCPSAHAGKIEIQVKGQTITIITGGVAPNNLPVTFTDAKGAVTNLGTVPMGKNPTLTIPNGTKVVGGFITLGPLVPGAGTITTPPLANGTDTYTSKEESAKKVGMGAGTATGNLASLPATIPFAPTSLTQSIQPPMMSSIALPDPTSISGSIDVTTTSDPEIDDVQFASFDAVYSAFNIPAMGLTGLTSEVLDPTASVSGVLDLTDDTMQVPLQVDWYDASNDLLTTSYEMLTVGLMQDSVTPDLLDYSFTSSGDFGLVAYSAVDEPMAPLPTPEPPTVVLLATSLAVGLAVVAMRRFRRVRA
jgi:hypothetical protein